MDLHSMMDFLNASMDLLDPAKVVNEVLIGLTIAVAGWIIYLLWKLYKNKNEKRILTGRLLSEIYRNQKLLEPLYIAAVIFESDERNFSEEIKIPKELKFNRSIYSESSNKLGLLDDESRKLIDNYYPELSNIENEFEKFDDIHGVSHEYLLGYLVNLNRPGHLDYNDNFLGGVEIEEFLRHAKKVYDLGAELIKSMKSE